MFVRSLNRKSVCLVQVRLVVSHLEIQIVLMWKQNVTSCSFSPHVKLNVTVKIKYDELHISKCVELMNVFFHM